MAKNEPLKSKKCNSFSSPKEKNSKYLFISDVCLHFFRRSPETRKRALKEICDRARSTDNLLPQLFLCPEGTNTNRKALIQFKVGAFAPGVPVQPVLIKYPGTERVGKYMISFVGTIFTLTHETSLLLTDAVTWTYNQNYSYVFSVWYLLANPINRVEVEFLPVYNPSEEEKNNPEIYARNVQKTMAEALNIPALDISYGAYYKNYCKQYNTHYEESGSSKKTD